MDGDDDPLFRPNHRLSPGKVYLHTVNRQIASRSSLELLYGLGLPKQPSDLPSWVPCFRGPGLIDSCNSFHSFSQLAQYNA